MTINQRRSKMTEDERAQMFYDEVMDQACVENPPSLKEKPKYPPEASGPGAPLSDASVKGFYTETESYLDFLSLY